VLVLVAFALGGQGCTAELTPEQKQLVTQLKEDLSRIRQDIEQVNQEDAAYSGGLIKALIGIRREVLKTNEALLEQRIHAIEGGARITIAIKAVEPDLETAEELAKEIESQKAKVIEARAEADRFSGGLVQAMAETTVATARCPMIRHHSRFHCGRKAAILR
jgi:hypothetical protein